jgi:hypothetical protein
MDCLLCVAGMSLLSWGLVGRETMPRIAENHLSPKATEMVKSLLGKESMADVASWADQVLKQPGYKNTAPWHY